MLLGAIYRKGNNSSIVLLSRSNGEDLTSLSLSQMSSVQKPMTWMLGKRAEDELAMMGECEGGPERRLLGVMQGAKSNRNKNNNIF